MYDLYLDFNSKELGRIGEEELWGEICNNLQKDQKQSETWREPAFEVHFYHLQTVMENNSLSSKFWALENCSGVDTIYDFI